MFFSALVYRFIPNLSPYQDIDISFTAHLPPSPIMVAQQFPYQRASFPFHLCDPLLDKFTSQTEAAVLALRAIRYLGHSAIHSALFFSPPFTVVVTFQIMNFLNLHRVG